ncbi:MAG: peptidase M2 family protein [Alphaproteobacteria bacterium]|nr:peptidase M2 family protein [Alphaproteobacteria bacterium]
MQKNNRLFAVASATTLLTALTACGAEVGIPSTDAAAAEVEASTAASTEPSTVEDAAAFVKKVEDWTREYGEYAARVAWLQATNITFDSNWLQTKVAAEGTEKGVQFANEAKRFNDLDLPPVMRRKIEAIKLGLNVPAPERPGAAAALAEVETRMGSTYSTGAIDLSSSSIPADEIAAALRSARGLDAGAEVDLTSVPGVDLEAMMGKVRNPALLAEMWTKWRDVPVRPDGDGRTMKDDYAAMVELGNDGARELGFEDVGSMWRARYDMEPAAFAAETDRLWGQVKPLYEQLHCHVRAELNEVYGDAAVPLDKPIRADLLGNMWAQSWGNIYDLVAPEDADPGYDLTQLLTDKGYTPLQMVKTGEAFFSSLGFAPLPETFWERSQITKPADREVVCHASAWDLDWADDIRIKMCTKVNADDFLTVHHELGHNYYQRAYQDKSVLFQTGANGGFHEAIGDMVALSITPDYLKTIGLLETTPDASKDIGLLMQQALEKIAFMPFGLLMDKWRWKVFAEEVAPQGYNDAWWRLREEYQGVTPPSDRPSSAFDPGSKYHIPANVSYTRYFIAHILQFQFHKAACDMSGWDGPLHRCSVYGSKEVGERFNAMLEMGAEKPWPEALEAFTGSARMDGEAVVAYFRPLMEWLEKENEGRSCGW